MSNKLRDRSARHDVFHQKAKKAGFVARSVFKLEEINQKYRLIKSGARVLDLGCRPGSWLQYAGRIAGSKAVLVGVDRTPLDEVIPGVRQWVGDVFQADPKTLLGELSHFDIVLTDMAPDTSGVRSLDQARSEGLFEHALGLAETLLVPGGHFVGKLFQGPDWQRLMLRARAGFEEGPDHQASQLTPRVHRAVRRGYAEKSVNQQVVTSVKLDSSSPVWPALHWVPARGSGHTRPVLCLSCRPC